MPQSLINDMYPQFVQFKALNRQNKYDLRGCDTMAVLSPPKTD